MTAYPPDGRKPADVTASLRMGMLRAATIFAVLGVSAGWLGIVGKAGTAVAIAKLLSFAFVLFFVILLTFGIIVGKRLRYPVSQLAGTNCRMIRADWPHGRFVTV